MVSSRSSFTPLETGARCEPSRSLTGFTLIELLIVIAIIAIVAVAVILTLNPLELLRQSRDANRLSDMETLNKAVSLYSADVGGSIGTAFTTYLSIPDASATSTAGDQCQGLGLPALPTGWSYHCASPSSYQSTDGTGWIPINFKAQSFGSIISSLPKDPTNTTSSGFYYTYTPAGSTYSVTATLESTKYLPKALNDGGYDPARYETGTDLSLVAKWEGLVGWWTFDEGAGTTAKDSSTNSRNGSWNGVGSHYVTGKVGSNAANFNGTNDWIDLSSVPSQTYPITIAFWANPSNSSPQGIFDSAPNQQNVIRNYIDGTCTGGSGGMEFAWWGDNPSVCFAPTASTWLYITLVFSYTSQRHVDLYMNGTLQASANGDSNSSMAWTTLHLGNINNTAVWYQGSLDDFRIYSRALSPAEISAIYNAEK